MNFPAHSAGGATLCEIKSVVREREQRILEAKNKRRGRPTLSISTGTGKWQRAAFSYGQWPQNGSRESWFFKFFYGTGITNPHCPFPLFIQFNESRQTDLLTPNGAREEVNRVGGEQIRVSNRNRDCRSVKLDEHSAVFFEDRNSREFKEVAKISEKFVKFSENGEYIIRGACECPLPRSVAGTMVSVDMAAVF